MTIRSTDTHLARILGLSVAVQGEDDRIVPRKEQHGTPLFGDLRWQGWADAILGGYADSIVVIGGIERMPPDTCPAWYRTKFPTEDGLLLVPRGIACTLALTTRYGVPVSRVDYRLSEGNTGGNVATIGKLLTDEQRRDTQIISSNHYHLPRAMLDLAAAGLPNLPAVPAEAYTIARSSGAGRSAAVARLIEAFGGGPLARRMAAEVCGVADKLNGTYAPLSR